MMLLPSPPGGSALHRFKNCAAKTPRGRGQQDRYQLWLTNDNKAFTRGLYKCKIGDQEIEGITVKEQYRSKYVATKSESLHETTWNITREDQIGVPSDIVLEANKVEEALVEADIHTKPLK